MDQQNRNPSPKPDHVPTEAEIARAEAEAVKKNRPAPEDPAKADFVPYVDDAPDPKPAPKPIADGDAPADDEDDEEYIPGKWEKRIDALSPEKWRLYQIIGGALLGLAAIFSLLLFRDELATYGLIVAALMVLLLPRYLERAWRRPLALGRRAMLIAMVVGLAIMVLILGLRSGFTFRSN